MDESEYISPITFGRCRPRYATLRSPERPTLGPNASVVADNLAKPFMPWQTYVSDVSLEVDAETGIPAYHTVIIVVMRQQGKTELLLPIMAHRAMGFERFGPQRILYTTQTGSKAREKWEDIHIKRLEDSPFNPMFTTRLRINQEAIMWVNGSFWSPGAGTAKTAGTGDSLCFGSIDEAWSADEKRELGMRPAMMTREESQLWLTSMVPGIARAGLADSQYLRKRMAMGRYGVINDVRSGIAYFEFGFDPKADPSDPETWLEGMPALCPRTDMRRPCECDPDGKWHHTITIASVKGDYDLMDVVDFQAEYGTIWPKDNRPTWTLLTERTWLDICDPESQPKSATALGVDMDEDRNQVYLAVAGKRADQHWHMEMLPEDRDDVTLIHSDSDWAVDRIVEVCEDNGVLCVAIDPRGPAQSLILPLENRGIEVLKPNTLDIAASCERWFDAVTGRDPQSGVRARHLGQRVLSNAVAYARKLVSAKNRTFAWDRIGGTVSISPLYAVTLAMFGYEAKMDDDYDVLDSVLGADGECGDCGKYPDYPDGPIDHYPDCEIAFPDQPAADDDDESEVEA